MSSFFFYHRTWQTPVQWFVRQGKQPKSRITICPLQQNQNLARISHISDLTNWINAVTVLINTFLLSDMSLSNPFSPPLILPRQHTVESPPCPGIRLQQWPQWLFHYWGNQWWPCTVTLWLWRQQPPNSPWQRSGELPELQGLTKTPKDGLTVIAISL